MKDRSAPLSKENTVLKGMDVEETEALYRELLSLILSMVILSQRDLVHQVRMILNTQQSAWG